MLVSLKGHFCQHGSSGPKIGITNSGGILHHRSGKEAKSFPLHVGISTCPHPYFNDNRQLTIRLILTIIIYLEATQLKLNFDVMCTFTTIIKQYFLL